MTHFHTHYDVWSIVTLWLAFWCAGFAAFLWFMAVYALRAASRMAPILGLAAMASLLSCLAVVLAGIAL